MDSVKIDGVTFSSISGMEKGSEQVLFTATDGREFVMWHDQDCCENVRLEDVIGDVADLMGSPVLSFECVTNGDSEKPGEYSESWTWTFYKFQTAKGHVTLRWLGESNGYYSEAVNFRLSKNGEAGWGSPDVENTAPTTGDTK